MNQLFGSHYFLTVLPIWVTALLMYFATFGVLFVLRDRCEGLFYNTSYSAMIGDGALMAIVLMAAGILQRGVPPPRWLEAGIVHLFLVLPCICVGVVWYRLDRPKQWGDRYHHLVIAPLFCYLGVTLVPVVYENGSTYEWYAMICLVLVWAVLVVYDTNTRRLNQRSYCDLGQHLEVINVLKRR